MRVTLLQALVAAIILLAPSARALAQAGPVFTPRAGGLSGQRTEQQPATRSPSQPGPYFAGRVLQDSADVPIPGAMIGLPGLGQVVRSDSLGRFAFPDRMSTRLILVRVTAIGYEPIETSVELAEGDTAEVDFILSRYAQRLGTVRIAAPLLDRRLREFERRRTTESGVFFNDSLIRRYAPSGRVSSLVSQRTQLRIVGNPRGVGTEQYVIGARGSELTIRGATPCYSAVLLDGNWVFSGQSGEPPFNINSIPTESIAAIEVYRSTADVPVEFRRLGRFCGLVVIWLK